MNGIDAAVMEELLGCLIQEAAAILTHAETCILKLEANPKDNNLIQEIFRAIHTIKGSSASVGLAEVSTFAHEVETVLAQVKSGRAVTSVLIGILLRSIDIFHQFFEIVHSKKDSKVDTSSVINDLKNLDTLELKATSIKSVQEAITEAKAGDIIFTNEDNTRRLGRDANASRQENFFCCA